MRHLLAVALLLTACACAGAEARPTPGAEPAPAGEPPGAELDASRTELAAIADAARDATAALAGDAARWDVARQHVPMPLDRAHLEEQLAGHARRHGLELSQFRLRPPDDTPLDLPARIHPASPYPLRADDAIVEPRVRFALTPLRPDRVEAFVRTLPEVTPLVIVQALVRGMDFVEVEATAPTFRQLAPAPTYTLEVPAHLAHDDRLADEVADTNLLLAELSDARLRHERLRAYDSARARAEEHAASIAMPPPARAGAAAPRTTAK
jgi:hypothetical protein